MYKNVHWKPSGHSGRHKDISERCQLPLHDLWTSLCIEEHASSHPAANLSWLWSEIRRVNGLVSHHVQNVVTSWNDEVTKKVDECRWNIDWYTALEALFDRIGHILRRTILKDITEGRAMSRPARERRIGYILQICRRNSVEMLHVQSTVVVWCMHVTMIFIGSASQIIPLVNCMCRCMGVYIPVVNK